MEDKKIGRYIFILIFICLSFIIYAVRLYEWQIVKGKDFLDQANTRYTYKIETMAKRGEIVDVNGVPLAINESSYTIVINKMYVEKESENAIILSLIDLFNFKGEKWIDELPIVINSHGYFEFLPEKEEEIEKMKKILILNNYANAQNCMDKIIQKYNLTSFDKETQRTLGSIRYNMTKNGYDDSMTSPYTFAKDITQETIAIVSEKAIKGIEIGSTDTRKYVNELVMPHIVGTIGKLSQEQYDKLKETYKMNDVIGKSGVEEALESQLKGKDGSKIVETTVSGAIIASSERNSTVPGNTVYLTIDSRFQEVANKTLEKNVNAAKASNGACKSGSVVMINVKDFSVLAAATYPTYDLQKYYTDDKYKIQLMTDETNRPLINRVFDASFTPGSIYKPVVAAAALQNGTLNLSTSIYCGGKFYYDSNNKNEYIRCATGPHGSISIVRALAGSCNVFFSETGRRMGIETLNEYAKQFSLGGKTGLEISESNGVLAGPEYSKEMGQTWYGGNTPQAALGQSDNMFTPIQIATFTATIANEGKRYKTHLVKKITDYSKKNIIMENSIEDPTLVKDVGISKENFEIVKEGMRQVVKSGTASSFANYQVSMGAKTGTAQNNTSHDHTTFICFAPFEEPEIAIAVILEYGSNGTYSKNIAKDMMDIYFSKQ